MYILLVLLLSQKVYYAQGVYCIRYILVTYLATLWLDISFLRGRKHLSVKYVCNTRTRNTKQM